MASSRQAIQLAGCNGTIEVHSASQYRAGQRLFGIARHHSRLANGRTVLWCATQVDFTPTALDAETIHTLIPTHFKSRLAERRLIDQLAEWTCLEVLAKLTDTPILLLLRGAVPSQRIHLVTIQVEDIIVSVGGE